MRRASAARRAPCASAASAYRSAYCPIAAAARSTKAAYSFCSFVWAWLQKILRNALQAFLQQRAIVQAHVPALRPWGLKGFPAGLAAPGTGPFRGIGLRQSVRRSNPLPQLGQCPSTVSSAQIYFCACGRFPSACEKFLDGALAFYITVALVFAQNSVAECFDIHRRTPSLFGFAFLFQYTIAPFRFQSSKPFVSRLFRCVPGTVPTLAAARRHA